MKKTKPKTRSAQLQIEVLSLKQQLADERHKNKEILTAWKNIETHRQYVKQRSLMEFA